MEDTLETILEAQDRHWQKTMPPEAYVSWRMTVMWRRLAIQQNAADAYAFPLVD
jgi:hypothetical protein